MKRFTSTHAQRFLSTLSGVSPYFWPCRHRLTAFERCTEMAGRFAAWRDVAASGVTSRNVHTPKGLPSLRTPNQLHHRFFQVNVTAPPYAPSS